MQEDAAVKFRELYENDLNAKRHLVERALQGDTGVKWEQQLDIAGWLYEARWDGRGVEEVSDGELLNTFCSKVFGCNAEGVLKAYDKFLG